MKYLISIDRNSIKKNPDAGRTHYQEFHGISGEFNIEGIVNPDLVSDLKNKFSFYPYQWKKVGLYHKDCRFKIFKNFNVDDLKTLLDDYRVPQSNWSYSITNNFQDIYSMYPEPKYHFQYEVTDIVCSECGQRFSHTDLVDSSDYDEDGNSFGSVATCPKCGELDCCQLEFEDINKIIEANEEEV